MICIGDGYQPDPWAALGIGLDRDAQIAESVFKQITRQRRLWGSTQVDFKQPTDCVDGLETAVP